MHGVIPLPPLKKRIRRDLSLSTNEPAGGVTISREPTHTSSLIQCEMRPSSTRFTVTLCSESQSGELDSE